jgi:hypothetical protein
LLNTSQQQGNTQLPRPADTPQTELFEGETFGALIPRKDYARALGVHPRTAVRYEKLDPDFPKVVYLNGHAFVTDVALERYKRAPMARGFTTTGTYPANSSKAGAAR